MRVTIKTSNATRVWVAKTTRGLSKTQKKEINAFVGYARYKI